MEKIKDTYKISRLMYILEAAFEYFISLLVSGAYLAKVTTAIGISDSLTGILTAFVSLGCGFQMIAIFLAEKRPVKRWVTPLHIINQLFFSLVYVVPFFGIKKTGKTIIFILLLLTGHIINNIVNSSKINWFMSLVEDHKRGRFTANKEIISLIGGVLFSFLIGLVIDHYEAMGDVNSAFIFCGVGIFVLMMLHTITLVCSKEKPTEKKEKISTKRMLGELIRDKKLFKVILVSVLWSAANYATTPFYGTYQNNELGFSMAFISLLSAIYAICRSLFSRPLGKFADRYSFIKMLNICFIIEALAFGLNMFTVPTNGKVMYTLHYMLYAIGMGGINSGEINLIYDYVDKERRVGALALKSTLAGFTGFFTTLLVSILVENIQRNGNVFFGMELYAQQVVSCIGFLIVLGILAYINLAFDRGKEVERQNIEEN